MLNQSEHTRIVKEIASQLGFAHCGISKAEFLEEEAPRLEQWLKQNMHGEMRYMEGHFDKRLDPSLLVPGAKSVVSLMFNYYPKEVQSSDLPKISKYAWGEDYHIVVKDKLFQFVDLIRERIGDVNGRLFFLFSRTHFRFEFRCRQHCNRSLRNMHSVYRCLSDWRHCR